MGYIPNQFDVLRRELTSTFTDVNIENLWIPDTATTFTEVDLSGLLPPKTEFVILDFCVRTDSGSLTKDLIMRPGGSSDTDVSLLTAYTLNKEIAAVDGNTATKIVQKINPTTRILEARYTSTTAINQTVDHWIKIYVPGRFGI